MMLKILEISGMVTAADAISTAFTTQCGALGYLNTPAVNSMLNENVSAADGFAWSWGNNGSTTTVTDDIPDMTVPQQKAAGYQASQFALLSIKDQVIYQHVTAYLE